MQDLLKYTPHDHPDRITLQMALARFEGIADYLNESKRITEQQSIVEYLNSRVSKLPFKLTDSRKRWLYRQDVVTRLVSVYYVYIVSYSPHGFQFTATCTVV